MKTFKEYINVNEGSLEDVKTKQVTYEAIAKEVASSKEYKAFVAYIQDLVTETFDYELDKTANDWAIVGVIAKLKWLD
jgi:hypothetical protein